jgi:hypothetical protein
MTQDILGYVVVATMTFIDCYNCGQKLASVRQLKLVPEFATTVWKQYVTELK